ncbi:hypothetical protein [Devosia sp.]|uniref:hypothetical protein n=1 Tax=Devosia sp. TaxID=1871048 RepID=UPI0027344A89|nr:hypothetical protein [Devosia sp.]MDP2779768.1 hypothetical protein [Devosia sp.]
MSNATRSLRVADTARIREAAAMENYLEARRVLKRQLAEAKDALVKLYVDQLAAAREEYEAAIWRGCNE